MPDREKVMPGLSANADGPVFVLSPRQREALSLAARGLTDIESARAMQVAPRTVRAHLRAARLKLRASNTTHAVWIAACWQLIETLPRAPLQQAQDAVPGGGETNRDAPDGLEAPERGEDGGK